MDSSPGDRRRGIVGPNTDRKSIGPKRGRVLRLSVWGTPGVGLAMRREAQGQR